MWLLLLLSGLGGGLLFEGNMVVASGLVWCVSSVEVDLLRLVPFKPTTDALSFLQLL